MIRDVEPSLAVTDPAAQAKSPSAIEAPLRGSVLVLIQFDVCEEIRLDQLRGIFGARTLEQPSLKHPAPGYVRYQRPPVVEPIDTVSSRERRTPAGPNQVLRLWRSQRRAGAAIFWRLGDVGSPR